MKGEEEKKEDEAAEARLKEALWLEAGSATVFADETGVAGQLVDQDTEAPPPPCFITSLVGGKAEAEGAGGGGVGAAAGDGVGTGAGVGAGAETGGGAGRGADAGGGFGVVFGVGAGAAGVRGGAEVRS